MSRMATLGRFLVCARWERRSGSPDLWQFRGRVRREWSARDFRAQNVRCAPVPGSPYLSFGPTSRSFPWKLFLLLDEAAHAQLRQCLLRVAEIAALEAVRPS